MLYVKFAVEISGPAVLAQQHEPSVPTGVKAPRVLVAALGPKMRLAGELADGTALGAQAWT